MSEVEAIEVPGQVHYIDGSFVGSVSGDTFDVINPATEEVVTCLLYTSPSPRDPNRSRMPSSA